MNNKFDIAKLLLIITVIVSFILFLHPLFKPGLIAGHDTSAHLIRAQSLIQAIKDGQFPVRWVEGPVPGLSHALFNYYPPLFYYPPAMLTFLGFKLIPSIYLTLALFTLLGWLGMYLFIKKLTNLSLPAVISASLFTFTPYHISQIYVRAAYLEFAATNLIPLAFWGILAIFKSQKITGLLTTAISLAAIISLHQPTFIMLLPAIIAWIGYLWLQDSSRPKILISLLALGTALLLAASFLLPLISESHFIRSAGLSANYFDFRQHFATLSQLIYSPWGYGISQPGPNDGLSFQVGVINWVILAVALGLAIWQKKIGLTLFFALIVLYGLFMATAASLPIWERFPTLSYIQYPWRYLAITAFATAVLVSQVTWLIPKNYLFIFIAVMVLFNWQYLAPAAYLPEDNFTFGSPNFPKTDPIMGLEPSYFPIQVLQTNSDPSTPRFQVTQGQAAIKTLTDKTTLQEFSAEVTAPATIQINTHYFPGWQATIRNGRETTHVTPSYNNPEGNLEISLAPGNYQVSLKFTDTPVRKVANYLSLTTILGLISLKIWQNTRK